MQVAEELELLIQDMEGQLEALQSSADFECDTNDKWQYRRGELYRLRALISLIDEAKVEYESDGDEDVNIE